MKTQSVLSSISLFAAITALATVGCDKKEAAATESSAAKPADTAAAAPATPPPAATPAPAPAPAAPKAIAWPGKKDDDVLVGSLNELEKDGTCSLFVLTAEQAGSNPKAKENLVGFMTKAGKGKFEEGKSCPTGEHLAGMCYSKQMSAYAVFYTAGGAKAWTEEDAKKECEKVRGKWSDS
jgi:hypothetical protein